MGKSALQSMLNIRKNRQVSTMLKLRLLYATAFSIASYGCESWTFTEIDRKRLTPSRCDVIEGY